MANEKRLIDADKLKERFLIVAQSGGPVVVHVSDICAAIEDEVIEESVDAVEVVRCRDCFANGCCSVQNELGMGGEGYCPKGRKERR